MLRNNLLLAVTVNGTFPNQEFIGVQLVAVPQSASDERTSMGHFQVGSLLLVLKYFLLTVTHHSLKLRYH